MRIQLELADEDVNDIKNLMKEARVDTYKELFGNALTILYWAAEEVKKGRIVGSIDEKSERYRELLMPILQNIAANQRRQDGSAGTSRAKSRVAR